MFNSGYKKEALDGLKRASQEHNQKYNLTIKGIESLHNIRIKGADLLENIEIYINSITNKPKKIENEVREVYLNRKNFQNTIDDLEKSSENNFKVSGSVAGAGVATGVGVAAFGPSAAMAIATTFGTASTGTAISALSGAAATNAALAWLGGGALAVGGGGMAAGEAFLALAGPVGWAIGGAALLGGGLLVNSKNKKIAEEAKKNTFKIKEEIENLKEIDVKVESIKKQINKFIKELAIEFEKNKAYKCVDYKKMSTEQKGSLALILNVSRSLSEKLCEKVN